MFTESQLERIWRMTRRSIAENEYNLRELSKTWTDEVALNQNPIYLARIKDRDELAELTCLITELRAQANVMKELNT